MLFFCSYFSLSLLLLSFFALDFCSKIYIIINTANTIPNVILLLKAKTIFPIFGITFIHFPSISLKVIFSSSSVLFASPCVVYNNSPFSDFEIFIILCVIVSPIMFKRNYISFFDFTLFYFFYYNYIIYRNCWFHTS